MNIKSDLSTETAVNLVRGTDVYSGRYNLQIKIADNQGFGSVQNLSVTVCDCTITSDCHVHRSASAQPSLSAIGIMIFALLLLLGETEIHTVHSAASTNKTQK